MSVFCQLDSFDIVTFNVRGLRSASKRRAVFRFFHDQYLNHVVVLQETHSSIRDCRFWEAEWGSSVLFSHGPNTNEAGVAVLIPRSIRQACTFTEMFNDKEGRFLVVDFAFESFHIKLFATYAPTQSNGPRQVKFIQMIRDQMEKIIPAENDLAILCGDLNIHLTKFDSSKDKFSPTRAARKLTKLMKDFNLVDVWRDKYPSWRRYTWRRLAPLQQSRIDYIFVSENVLDRQMLRTIEIRPGILSDHSLVNLELTLFKGNRGPGLWRFNNSLLEDTNFVYSVKEEVNKFRQFLGLYAPDLNSGVGLEMLMSQIRVICIRCGKRNARNKAQDLRFLFERLERCEIQMCSDPSEDTINRYTDLKNQLNDLEEEKGRRAMLLSGAKWIEQGEKPTAYFLKLLSDRASKKSINILEGPDGRMVTENSEILELCKNYFEDIYRTRIEDNYASSDGSSLMNITIQPRLNDEDRLSCEGPLSNEECKFALEGMLNNKAPSVSGFSKEFMLFFWDDMGDIVTRYVNDARRAGCFFITQRRGVITLIPKKGDQKNLRNKRAICLLDIIYKIVAKVLANRLSRVISRLVSPDQTGSIKGRYIGSNIRTISDVIEYSRAQNMDGVLLGLDFRNAFNTVEHAFVYDVLNAFNFGPDFIQWVKLLHKGTELAVINNGFTSTWFSPTRGLQQGCPLSGPLFALVAEILAIRIRESELVPGICISGQVFKISQYCDDMTLFVKDHASAQEGIRIVQNFGKMSGLELNMEKSQFMWLGKNVRCGQAICGIKANTRVKILGVWFSANQSCTEMNINPIIENIKSTLNRWSQRDLTLKGKITVAKSLIVSRLIYVMSAMDIPRKLLDIIQSHVMRFLWRGRPPKVARSTLYMNIESGGLKAPNLELVQKSNRIAWVGRLCRMRDLPFVEVLERKLKMNIVDVLKMNFNENWINSRRIPEFYTSMFKWFREANPIQEPTSGTEVRRQIFWNNEAIRVQGKPVMSSAVYGNGIKHLDDFFDDAGNVLAYDDFIARLPQVHINPLTYMGWCRAIPMQWKQKVINSEKLRAEERAIRPVLEINGKAVPLWLIKSRYFYSRLLTDRTPAAQLKWEENNIDFEEGWRNIFALPFQITKSTKLQSLQYRITHRFFPTRRYLFIRNVVDDPFCDECGEVDSLEHYFVECEEVKTFWRELANSINRRVERKHAFICSKKNILFGCLDTTNIVNLIILIAKQYIVNQRFREGQVTITSFIVTLNKYFEIEKSIALKNLKIEKMKVKWNCFISEALKLSLTDESDE